MYVSILRSGPTLLPRRYSDLTNFCLSGCFSGPAIACVNSAPDGNRVLSYPTVVKVAVEVTAKAFSGLSLSELESYDDQKRGLNSFSVRDSSGSGNGTFQPAFPELLKPHRDKRDTKPPQLPVALFHNRRFRQVFRIL